MESFGAPHYKQDEAFDTVDNPLRGQSALSVVDCCVCTQEAFPETTSLKIIWAADRDAVTDEALSAWVTKCTQDHKKQGIESCANTLMQGFYNTLMPLHCELWWTYTTQKGLVKRIALYRSQPLYTLPDILKERITQGL